MSRWGGEGKRGQDRGGGRWGRRGEMCGVEGVRMGGVFVGHLLSSHVVGAVVMKNCEPFVLGPAFAIDSVYGRSWRSERWNSSSNS